MALEVVLAGEVLEIDNLWHCCGAWVENEVDVVCCEHCGWRWLIMEEAKELGIEMIKNDIPVHLMRTRIAPYKIYEELGILNEIKKPIFIQLIGAGTPNKPNLAFFEIDESHYVEDEEEAFNQGFWSGDYILKFLDIDVKERPEHGFAPVGYVMNKGFKTLYDVRNTEQFKSFLLRQTESPSEE